MLHDSRFINGKTFYIALLTTQDLLFHVICPGSVLLVSHIRGCSAKRSQMLPCIYVFVSCFIIDH